MKIELDIDPNDRDIYESEDFQRFIHKLNTVDMNGFDIIGDVEVLADTQEISHGRFINNLWHLYEYDRKRDRSYSDVVFTRPDFSPRVDKGNWD